MTPPRLLLFAALLLSQSVAFAQGTIYVRPDGNDAAAGTKAAPIRTLHEAIVNRTADIILLAEGDYVVEQPLTLTGSRQIVGNLRASDFESGSETITRLVLPDAKDNLGFPLPGLTLADSAKVRFLTATGGRQVIELRDTALLDRVRLEGDPAASNSTGVTFAGEDTEATVSGCIFEDLLTAVSVKEGATATVKECQILDTRARSVVVEAGGKATLSFCEVRDADTDAVAFLSGSQGVIEGCAIQRNFGNGLRLLSSSVQVVSSLISYNQNGVVIENSNPGLFHNTIAQNRSAGLRVQSNAKPLMFGNVIALNTSYGLVEDLSTGGSLVRNLFNGNGAGGVLESDQTVSTTAAELNTLDNPGASVSANRDGNPVFVSPPLDDFRLGTGSVALDVAPNIPALVRDVQGTTRLRDIPGVGFAGGDALDLGAFESGPMNTIDFGAVNFEWNIESDIGVFNPFPVQKLPGRIRFSGINADAYGTSFQNTQPTTSPRGMLAFVRYRLSQAGWTAAGMPDPRMRLNGLGSRITATYSISSRGNNGTLVPGIEGRDYFLLVDFENGGLPSATTLNPLRFSGSVDMLDFGRGAARAGAVTPVDFEEYSVSYLPRTALGTPTLVKEFTFATNEEGWTKATVPGVYTEPPLAYNGAATGLSLAGVNGNTYGSWNSPLVTGVEAGDVLKVTWTIQSSQTTPSLVPQLRLRAATNGFGFINTLGLDFFVGDFAQLAPNAAGRNYTMYVFLPQNITLDGLFLAIDLMGFNASRGTVPVVLTNVRVERF